MSQGPWTLWETRVKVESATSTTVSKLQAGVKGSELVFRSWATQLTKLVTSSEPQR